MDFSMIPQFPQFKPLELSDRKEIEAVTGQFPPYSDFNFTSLWAWNISESAEVSLVNNFLVIRMKNYISQEMIWLLCGTGDADKTLTYLFNYLSSEHIPAKLTLVPEEVVDQIKEISTFSVEEDTTNHDYILSVDELCAMSGSKWRGKKNFINRFFRLYGETFTVESVDLSRTERREDLVKTFLQWAQNAGLDESFYYNELKAFYRLLRDVSHFSVSVLGVYVDGHLEGFTIFEQVNADYIIIHFEKANTAIVGIYTFLNRAVAEKARELGCTYINYEQDLGIVGLSNAKKAYHPVALFEKYTISPIVTP